MFEGKCQKRTNVGNTAIPPALTAPVNTLNPTQNTCVLLVPLPAQNNIPPSNNSNGTNNASTSSTTSFNLTNSTFSTVTTLSQTHYKTIIEFYLIRVGQWQPNDRVDVYINDLLMLSKNYSAYGNKLC